MERSLSEGEGLSFLRLADSLFSLGMSCWLWGIEILNWIENWYKIFWMILSSVPFYVYMYQRFSPLFVEKWNIIVFKCQCIYGKMKYSFCIYLCYWPIDILYLNYDNDFIRQITKTVSYIMFVWNLLYKGVLEKAVCPWQLLIIIMWSSFLHFVSLAARGWASSSPLCSSQLEQSCLVVINLVKRTDGQIK